MCIGTQIQLQYSKYLQGTRNKLYFLLLSPSPVRAHSGVLDGPRVTKFLPYMEEKKSVDDVNVAALELCCAADLPICRFSSESQPLRYLWLPRSECRRWRLPNVNGPKREFDGQVGYKHRREGSRAMPRKL